MSLETIAPIERAIRLLASGLQSVKDEQEYIVVRERTHRNTAESTNSRVKWWSILQAIVLFSVVAWQVWYLKVGSYFVSIHTTAERRQISPVFLRGQASLLDYLQYNIAFPMFSYLISTLA